MKISLEHTEKEIRNFIQENPHHKFSKRFKSKEARYWYQLRYAESRSQKGTYTRVFSDPKKTKRALKMFREGYTYDDVGKVLGCERTSARAFYKRKIFEGVSFEYYDLKGRKNKSFKKLNWWNELSKEERENNFVDFLQSNPKYQEAMNRVKAAEFLKKERRESRGGSQRYVSSLPPEGFDVLENGERVNRGKASYVEYLIEYEEEIKDAKEKRMKKAKKTLERMKKKKGLEKRTPKISLHEASLEEELNSGKLDEKGFNLDNL